MSPNFVVALEIDARGLACPMPLLKARQAIRQLDANDILHLTASDPGALRDIPSWLRQAGHELVQQDEEQGVFNFWIRRCAEGHV